MRRRDLITLSGAAAAWSFGTLLGTLTVAREQSKITILHSGFPNRTPIHVLIEALAKLGYENIARRRLIFWAEKVTQVG